MTTALVGPVTSGRHFDFTGCSNWSGPAHLCACETWEPTYATCCGYEIAKWDDVVCTWNEEGDGYTHVRECPIEEGLLP